MSLMEFLLVISTGALFHPWPVHYEYNEQKEESG